MDIWICNGCHAEIIEGEPKNCPLCGQHQRGFAQAEKPMQDPEDKKYLNSMKKPWKRSRSTMTVVSLRCSNIPLRNREAAAFAYPGIEKFPNEKPSIFRKN